MLCCAVLYWATSVRLIFAAVNKQQHFCSSFVISGNVVFVNTVKMELYGPDKDRKSEPKI